MPDQETQLDRIEKRLETMEKQIQTLLDLTIRVSGTEEFIKVLKDFVDAQA